MFDPFSRGVRCVDPGRYHRQKGSRFPCCGKLVRVTSPNAPLALLDAASLYFRSYFALPDSLVAPNGQPVNAVRGYADTIARILTERRPSRLVSCLDADWRPEFRVRALPS